MSIRPLGKANQEKKNKQDPNKVKQNVLAIHYIYYVSLAMTSIEEQNLKLVRLI